MSQPSGKDGMVGETARSPLGDIRTAIVGRLKSVRPHYVFVLRHFQYRFTGDTIFVQPPRICRHSR